jgi:ketosteroid isomerase-like protein
MHRSVRTLATFLLLPVSLPLLAQQIQPQQMQNQQIESSQLQNKMIQASDAKPKTSQNAANGAKLTPIEIPDLTKAQLELIKLELDFCAAVSKGGGRAFASYFADDAVTLNNGRPAVLGLTAIAASAQWDPKTYQLSWYPQGAQMGPSNDTGFTWGHYDAVSNRDGKSSTVSGRYITFWKKVKGVWKVALDASSEEPDTQSVLGAK